MARASAPGRRDSLSMWAVTLPDALRLTEILLAGALVQQSLEHLASRVPGDRWLFAPRLIFAGLLGTSVAPGWAGVALLGHSLLILRRYDGPYNGGADRMTLLILTCLTAAHLAPTQQWQELAFAYLAVQLVLSYVISGWVKLKNPDWRSGRALQDVFLFSAYPVSGQLRALSARRGLLATASWGVILFEVLFPLSLLHPLALVVGLIVAALFHLANACLFGLNRFFWAWLAAYPSILWAQDRLIG